MSAMPNSTPSPSRPERTDTPAALQAQILATEHWSLLASRTTTQNEVLTRISMFLTFVSATLVSLALVGQATGFGAGFPLFVIAVLAVALAVGMLTQIRVFNVATEDLMYVLAMNRLRAAYAELAPGVEKWFMSSHHDDQSGSERTYYFLRPGRGVSVVLGSSMMFIVIVNAALAGLLGATILVLGAGQFSWPAFTPAVIVGVLVAIVYFVTGMWRGYRSYRRVWEHHEVLSPTPAA
jgi:hypothetical protein